MVRGAHHNTHLVGQSRRLGVVLVECRCPHGRPEIVGLQTQQQLEYLLVGLGVNATEVLLAPRAERGPFVVDEDAAIFHGRPVVIASGGPVQLILMNHWCISHPVPGRHTDAARNLVNAEDGAPFVAACNDQVAIHNIDDISLPATLDRLYVEFLLLDEAVDSLAPADGSDIYRGER